MNLLGQTGYDHIDREALFILKAGFNKQDTTRLCISEIRNFETAESIFGKPDEINQYFDEMSKQNYTRIVYQDGLELRIPEIEKTLRFNILSENYSVLLKDGQEIKIGMAGENLKAIFPDSYQKRIIISNIFNKGKISVSVFFSRIVDNKVIFEDSYIDFILNEKSQRIEQIRTYYPQ